MAELVLVLPNDPEAGNAKYRTNLGGEEFLVKVRLNERMNRYFVELYNAQDELVIGSAKIISNWVLFAWSGAVPGMPAVPLLPQTFSADTTPPGEGELGENQRVQLTVLEGFE